MVLETSIVRLIVTFLISLIFGLERQKSHNPAGFGTYVFVSVGSCSLAIISLNIGAENPLPLLAAVVTGIGFLGAGAFIRTSDKVFGFTTAVSIWIFAIIGLIIGLGNYRIGIMTYALVWIILFIDRFLQSRKIGAYRKKLYLRFKGSSDNGKIRESFEKFKINDYKLVQRKINKQENYCEYLFLIESHEKKLYKALRKLEKEKFFLQGSID